VAKRPGSEGTGRAEAGHTPGVCTLPEAPAWRSGSAQARLWLTAGAGWAADLLSKAWALRTIGHPDQFSPDVPQTYLRPITVIPDYVTLVTQTNPGAVAGLWAGRTGLLLAVSGAAMVFLLWLFCSSGRRQALLHVALGLLLAGAAGNLYDRLFRGGRVVDFIKVDLHIWPANPWPTFNVADVWLCVGVGLLLLGMAAAGGAAREQENR